MLIETKLVPPRTRAGVLRRRRLLETLDDSAAAALTLVSGPAGYGKTLLLVNWCAEQPAPVIWNALDANDSDPVRLWTHLAAAASRASRGLGGDALARLSVPGPEVESAVEAFLASIARYGEPLVIVLDDLHAIGSEESFRSIEYAITRLPANARVLASTRSDPPLALARLRASRQLAEIRMRELAFTEAEARELIVRTEGIPLTNESVSLLVERTEGWPAAVYLAVLWLRDSSKPDEAARRIGASTRQVADYLTEEILATLEDGTRDFLSQTAALSRFTPELCDVVLERDDSRAILGELERSNLLLVALDNEGEWYRYHHLFQELLLLEFAGSSQPNVLHERAARWFRDHGLFEEAIAHAGDGGNLELAADIMVEADRENYWAAAERFAFVQSWVERLPAELLVARPSLPSLGALAANLRGRPLVEIERLLVVAERARLERPEAWGRDAEAYLAFVRSLQDEGDGAGHSVAYARAAVEAMRAGRSIYMVAALAVLARALFFAGDLAAARQAAFDVVTRSEAEERPLGYLFSLGVLAAIEAEEARPEHAVTWARQAIDYARKHGLGELWIAAIAHLGLSDALAQMGRLSEAEREATRGEALWRGSQSSIGHAYALIRLADARIARSRLRQAKAALAAAEREIAEFPDPGRLPALAAAIAAKLTADPVSAPEVVEPPSPGELAVLRYLPSELSQREIAASLYVSLNTVRTHMRALYRKLHVRSREGAVARADELGLLDETDSPG